MIMDKIFFKVVKILQFETETTEFELLHDKHEEYVNYRILLIQALRKLGYSDKAIADKLGFTRQGVCWLRNQFAHRIKHRYTLANHWKEIDKQLLELSNDSH